MRLFLKIFSIKNIMNWESINRFLTIFNVILALINVILVLKQLQKSPNIILKLENKKRILENIWNATLYNWIVYLDRFVKEDKKEKKYISVNSISAFRTEESKEETEARRRENISEK